MKILKYDKFDENLDWSEAKLKLVLGEDDRFEYKSGLLFDNESTDKIEEMLAKEICAFANSFGGTIFLGVKDKTYEIDGVIKTYKGDLIKYLERKIPNLISFRLPFFRVKIVNISKKTQTRIGTNRIVVAINIFDSSLAPHQVNLGSSSPKDKLYFYRENASSVPAPHSYLTYLWGRNSQNMSEVVRSWFVNYLNSLIEYLKDLIKFLTNLDFSEEGAPKEYFNEPLWNTLNDNLSAQQFLKMFPELKRRTDLILSDAHKFEFTFSNLQEKTINSPELDAILRDICNKYYSQRRYELYNPEGKSFNEILIIVFDELNTGSANNLEIVRYSLTRNIINAKLGCVPNNRFESSIIFFNWCKTEIASKLQSAEIDESFASLKENLNVLKYSSSSLLNDLEEFRFELALKHNTTYF